MIQRLGFTPQSGGFLNRIGPREREIVSVSRVDLDQIDGGRVKDGQRRGCRGEGRSLPPGLARGTDDRGRDRIARSASHT